MAKEVQHVKSCCGGGKSLFTLQELYQFITQNPDETVVFASKTNRLTAQNHENLLSVAQASSANTVDLQRIDTTTTPPSSTVLKALNERLDRPEGGVVFISHATLQNVDATKMQHVRLIIDEVPNVLVQHLRVSYEHKDHGSSWEKYIITQPCQHSKFKIAALDPSSSIEDIQRRIDNIKQGVDNSVTKEVASLLEFLLSGHEVMYTRSSNHNGKTVNLYLATQWKQLEALAMNAKRLAILSSQVKYTLIGFVLEKVMNCTITPTNINDDLTLEELHRSRALIYPLIEKDKWSAYLKKKKANESLLSHGLPVHSEQTVNLYTQEIAHKILQGEPSLLILNNKDDEHDCWDNHLTERISSDSHGMNSYTNYDHAVFLSSKRPDSNEANALRLFALDHGLSKDEIMKAVLTERCYESAYQCIARTSIRNQSVNSETTHIFVVPDEAHAEYVAGWFYPGMATVDRSHLHQLKPTTASQAKDKTMYNLIVQIRTDFLAKKGKLKELLQQHNLNKKTYQRNIEKFREKLEDRGLISPKRSLSKTDTKTAA